MDSLGYIIIDGWLSEFQDCLDMPKGEYLNANIAFYITIPPYGTFTIEGKKLVRYLRGERTEISQKALDWEGFDFNLEEFRKLTYGTDCETYAYYASKWPVLKYDEENDVLYLTTFDADGKAYRYVFTNYREEGIIVKIN